MRFFKCNVYRYVEAVFGCEKELDCMRLEECSTCTVGLYKL